MKKIFTLFVLLIISASIKIKAQVDVNDSLAVVDFYNSTNGDNWYHKENWLSKEPLGTWYGIEVRKNRVFKIYSFLNNLTGTIPASIGNLTELHHLYLDESTFLKGPIPSTIGNLKQLQTLVLTALGLSGIIPDEITKLVNLRKLCLQNNYILTGSIPADIGKLTNLRTLILYANSLSGSIPSSIGNCTNLVSIDLHENKLTGPLPSSIGNLTSLKELNIADNQLSGEIPNSIGNLINLESITFIDNKLTGSIPSTLHKLINLTDLNLNDNQLSGQIPASLGKLTHLTYIGLEHNELTGSIPSSLGNCTKLSIFILGYNNLSGPVPSTLTNFTMGAFELEYNQLTFEGMEAIAEKYENIGSNLQYAPQALRPAHQNGNNLSVYAGGTLSNNTYTWYKVGKKNGTVIKGDSVFHPTSNGSYYVNVTNKIATQLTITSDTILYSVSSEIGNADSKTNSSNLLISVYPNPVKDFINIHSASVNIYTVQIINANGVIVGEQSLNNNDVGINITNYASGIYFIKLQTNTGIITKKITKQ